MASQFSPKATESNQHSDLMIFPTDGSCCCFYIPCCYRWRKVPSKDEEDERQRQSNGTLWSRGVAALKKIREWSEIVAGPRWKTFIRRFNHSNSFSRQQASEFQYDPLSYALNFDQGPLQNGDPETEKEYMIRNFSSRYVLPPQDSAKRRSMSVKMKSVLLNFV